MHDADLASVLLHDGQPVLVDEDDLALVAGFSWYPFRSPRSHTTYAGRQSKRRHVSMHRLILGLGLGDPRRVDHQNGNGLDNRRSNLRLATDSQNAANRPKTRSRTSSQYKGVRHHRDRWQAFLQADRRFQHLGLFDSEVEAALAYDAAAVARWGDFARTNFKEAH